MKPLRTILVTSFGLGFLRPAPGTWGSLPPPALAFLLILLGVPGIWRDAALAAVCMTFSIACLAFGRWAEQRFGRKDASHIVADETAGQCLPLLMLPTIAISTPLRAMLTCGGAFLLFRLFDIVKPPPAKGLQRLPAGAGVLIDDLFAGFYAAIVVQIATRFALPALGV